MKLNLMSSENVFLRFQSSLNYRSFALIPRKIFDDDKLLCSRQEVERECFERQLIHLYLGFRVVFLIYLFQSHALEFKFSMCGGT